MSAAGFGLTSRVSLLKSPLPLHQEQSREPEALARRYETLSCLSLSLVSQAPENLSASLGALIRPLLDFDFMDLIVFKQGTSEVLWHSIGAGQLPTRDVPMEETTYWWVYQQKQPLYISDWSRDERFASRRDALKKLGFEYRSLCRLPLRTPNGPIGVLSFASFRPHEYSEEEIRFLLLAADQVSLAVSSVLHLETSRRTQSELDVMSARLKLLGDLTNSLVANLNLDDLLRGVTVGARLVVRSDAAIVGLLDLESGSFQVNAFDVRDDTVLDAKAVNALAETLGTSKGNSTVDAKWPDAGFRHSCALPLVSRDQTLGILAIGKREDPPYNKDEIEFLNLVAGQVAVAVDQAVTCGELRKLKDNSRQEKICLENETRTDLKFEEIVGRSAALKSALRQVEVVAPTDSGVLIKGETGTGKELIARAIHNLSNRRDWPFVKLNCAAIPSGLLESELFGHEKGAFTGAIVRKAGRFEVADKGTLFLDEVGDIPLELQPKLLRVLQEREFERLGSSRTQQVDVRVIAATHRDLKQMVEDGEFRSDLYYRLHVFPLHVPSLRDRREDIPLLVRHYADKYSRRMNRRIETIPSQALEALATYPWPGNVRELQNFIERAVILSPGSVLRVPLAELKEATVQSSKLSTLEEAERDHVLRALRESSWVVGGANGAAARLGMKRTTLAYHIRKLKIPCRPQ